MIRLGIVDDREHVLETIKARLSYTNEIETVLCADNGFDFLETVKKLNFNVRPDVILMDIDMPALNGIDTVNKATALYPDMKFIMLTVFDDEDKIFDAIKAGAHGYLLKDEKIDEIIEYIKLVYENKGAVMSPAIARKALDMLVNKKEGKSKLKVKDESNLTARELDVLKALVDGYDHKSIAVKLSLSPATVRTHMANIYKKMQVTSKSQAVGLALKKRWFGLL